MSEHDPATDGDDVLTSTFPPISQQLRAYQGRTGDSTHDVSRRSAKSGHRVTQKYVHDLRSGRGRQWPRQAATFTGLAAGIETTELAIVLGYAAEFGVPVEMSEFATRLPPGVDDLDEHVKEAILGVLWAVTTGGSARRFLPDDEVPDESELAEGLLAGPPRDQPGEGEQQ